MAGKNTAPITETEETSTQTQDDINQAPVTPVVEEEEPTEENTAPDKVEVKDDIAVAPAVIPAATVDPIVSTPSADTVNDDVTEKATPAPVVEEPVAAEEVDLTIQKLRALFATFVEANKVKGKRPEDFTGSANAILKVIKYLITNPSVPILDEFLALFTENLNGATSASRFMLGSTTLAKQDEVAVGVILALFGDLANKRNLPIASGMVTSILKKPEFVGFYNRRRKAYAK